MEGFKTAQHGGRRFEWEQADRATIPGNWADPATGVIPRGTACAPGAEPIEAVHPAPAGTDLLKVREGILVRFIPVPAARRWLSCNFGPCDERRGRQADGAGPSRAGGPDLSDI